MEGITIIQEHFCRETTLFTVIVVGIFAIILGTAFIFSLKRLLKESYMNDDYLRRFMKFFIIVSIVTIILGCAALIKSYFTTHIEYTVTVNDSVGFNEFMEKYEIISVDGNEYRVKEKVE